MGIKASQALLVALSTLVAVPAHAETVWRLQSIYTSGDPVGEELGKFAERVGRLTGGRLSITVIPVGGAVGITGTLDAVKAGVLDGHISYSPFWAGINPAFAPIGDLPGGFDSPYQVSEYFYQHGGLELMRELYAEHNIFTIGVTSGGPESLPSRVPIKTVGDFKGLKIRVPAGMGGQILEALGATTVNLPFSEVFSALERGVVDGADSASFSYNYALGIYDRAKYSLNQSPHANGVLDVSVNRELWEAQPEDIQEILEMATRDLMGRVIARIHADDTAVMKKATEEGVTISTLSPEERQKFRDAAQKVWGEWSDRSPAAKKVIDSQTEYLRLIGSL